MKGKRGFELSFSMIFSIIVIIAIIGVAFYVISYFINLKNCTELGLFGRDLQETVDRAWNSDTSNEVFTDSLPGFVKEVCIGNLQQGSGLKEYESLRRFRTRDANLFFYPVPACEIMYKKIEHAQFQQFACVPIVNGKVSLKVVKGSTDNLVFVCQNNSSCGNIT